MVCLGMVKRSRNQLWFLVVGTSRHGRVVEEHVHGSWAEFIAFSRTWEFVACFRMDGINAGGESAFLGIDDKCHPGSLHNMSVCIVECSIENIVHFRFKFNVL